MATTYDEKYRKQIVSQYQQLWADKQLSVDDFSQQVCIHHTTIRKWLKTYAPKFEQVRRGHKQQPSQNELNDMGSTTSGCQSVTVQAEWYEHNEPNTDNHQDDLIRQLRDEIVFLKRQVSYWMQQESIVA